MTTRIDSKQKIKENLPNSGLCLSNRPQAKTERKQKETLVHRPC